MSTITPTRKAISAVLKIIVVISALVGTFLSSYSRKGGFMSGMRSFMYFTIQSNIALAIICFIGLCLLLRKQAISRSWYVVKFVGTVSITVTGAVFCFVLAPTMGRGAWAINNVLTHVVVPIASIVDFFVTGVDSEIPVHNIGYTVLPPIAYAIYAGIGYIRGWEFYQGVNYPYFFLNWGSPAGAFGFTKGLPFMGCVWWILALLVFILAMARGYLALLNRMKKRF